MGIKNMKDIYVYLPSLDDTSDNIVEVIVTKENPSNGTSRVRLRNEMTQAFQCMFEADFAELVKKWESKIKKALTGYYIFTTVEDLEEFAKRPTF